MPEILDWQQAAAPNTIVSAAARELAAGRIVVFPTECTYLAAASANVPGAVERLSAAVGAEPKLSLAVFSAEEVADWVPHLSLVGQRLARRCWPGPVELVWGEEAQCDLASRLGEPVRQRLCGPGTLGLRCPAHEAIRWTMQVLPGPLVLGILESATGEATTIEQACEHFQGTDTLVIDDGPSRYGRSATVVRIEGNAWHVIREGIVSRDVLEELTCCVVLFVCTGNTCRSPLAEALCKKLLADRLGCRHEELPQRGFVVQSAGLSAMMGAGAAVEAVAVARQHGADLSAHVSRPITAEDLARADFVLTMTRSHLFALEQLFPQLGPTPRLLAAGGDDIADPIGSCEAVYQECAQQILCHLERFLTEVHPL